MDVRFPRLYTQFVLYVQNKRNPLVGNKCYYTLCEPSTGHNLGHVRLFMYNAQAKRHLVGKCGRKRAIDVGRNTING